MRVVIDPGVFVSALLSGGGSPGLLVRRWLDGEVEVVASPQLLDELVVVLERPRFRAWVTVDDARAFVSLVSASVLTVPDPPPAPGLSPDPGDDYLIALARSSRVEALVTGEGALLAADLGVVALTPAHMLAELDRRGAAAR